MDKMNKLANAVNNAKDLGMKQIWTDKGSPLLDIANRQLNKIQSSFSSKNENIVFEVLNSRSNFQLLIAVLLSAQCTDKRVNKVTPKLFSIAKISKSDLQFSYFVKFQKN